MTEAADDDDDDDDDDAMFMRTFELDGEPTVEAWVWPPEEDEDMQAIRCYYQIVGMGDEKFRSAYGVDGFQALTTALNFIAVHLYNSDEYKAGRLTFYGAPDLHLPERPGLRFDKYGHENAAVIFQSQHYGMVLMPQERFPRIAIEAQWFKRLGTGVKAVALRKSGKRRANRLARSLRRIRAYYEAVCKQEGLALPYADKPKK
ncbi:MULTISPECIES: DUF6968 family protein [Asticcacaulis]|uniref:DUF6968 family protein n=1 Tax=Asticcacaulis TaxID=76890 RepID=UPI001AE4D896|nr:MULTISPECIES: hypothetical protein [Asticcacaulis]MBP2161896.1 hypothetical protein [Asticcacaulis solisilvae]MDR6802942.1 hypothetical protein [Asticcacaulis sp. BE141]